MAQRTRDAGRSGRVDPSVLAAKDGTFRMLAIDQRESLRTLLEHAGHPAGDADLSAFKVAAAGTLSGAASGLLIDPLYGLDAVLAADAVAPGCGLIVAVDRLVQRPGGPLEGSELDLDAMAVAGRERRVRALKFLVLYRPDDPAGPRDAMVEAFVDGCRRLGVVSLLEGLIQVPGSTDPDVFDAAVLAAASAFAPVRPDVYKTHVPTLGTGSLTEIRERSEAVSAAIGRPWVVLSAGVDADRFPAAVAAAGAGGASGFLAGRGVWGPAIAAADPAAALATDGRRRLEELSSIAATFARPWWEVSSAA